MKKGDIIRCINGSMNPNFDYKEFNQFPIEGHKYKVRRLENLNGIKRVLLVGAKNKTTYCKTLLCDIEAAYSPDRFILESNYHEYAKKRINNGFFVDYN